jgi:hypothetical protein
VSLVPGCRSGAGILGCAASHAAWTQHPYQENLAGRVLVGPQQDNIARRSPSGSTVVVVRFPQELEPAAHGRRSREPLRGAAEDHDEQPSRLRDGAARALGFPSVYHLQVLYWQRFRQQGP